MHFAMPPRKTSRPPPYAPRQQRSGMALPYWIRNMFWRDRLRKLLVVFLGLLAIWYLFLSGGRSSSAGKAVPGIPNPSIIGTGPPAVIVTVLDPNADTEWTQKIKRNRDEYAKKHGYLTFFTENNRYPLNGAPTSWSKVMALRHAIAANPSSLWFWYLDSSAMIMNPEIPLAKTFLNPRNLESLMITGMPVVPPDSVIKTFSNLRGERIDLVLTQDKEGLSTSSIIVRNGEWAKFFLDVWNDNIYKSYNFQKAETHALEHIVQWHGTILAKLAMIPQNTINAYAHGPAAPSNGKYTEGDLVATFFECDKAHKCYEEQKPFWDILDSKSTGQD